MDFSRILGLKAYSYEELELLYECTGKIFPERPFVTPLLSSDSICRRAVVKIARTSVMSGKRRTMELDVTEGQMLEWQNGGLIQDVMPNLSADEREFIMTGVTPEEWDELDG